MSERSGWYVFFRKCFRILFQTIFRWKVVGLENVPKQGPAVICSNHISLLDPPLVGSASKRPIHFMAKEELFHIPVLSYFLPKILAFPVKRGKSDMKAVKTAIKILKNNELFGIFPEGTRKKAGVSEEEAEEGAVFIALKAKVPIIPVALIGPYRFFRPVRVVFGEPIDTTPYTTSKISKEIVSEVTRIMMDKIHVLIQQNR